MPDKALECMVSNSIVYFSLPVYSNFTALLCSHTILGECVGQRQQRQALCWAVPAGGDVPPALPRAPGVRMAVVVKAAASSLSSLL